MTAVVEGQSGTAKQVQLYSVLNCHRAVNQTGKLVRAEDIVRVRLKLLNRDKTFFKNSSQLLNRVLSLIVKSWIVVDWGKDGIAQGAGPVVALFG